MAKRRNTEEWIKYLNEIHSNKYDYSKTDFSLGVMMKNIITCPKHGDWYVTIDNHSTKKSGCPKCSGDLSTNEKKEIAKKIHNNKYSYDLILKNNIKNHEKVEIICPIHGVFTQTWTNHVNMKQGCKKCRKVRSKLTIEDLKNKTQKLQLDNITYVWETYTEYLTPMEMICKDHGSFRQSIANHLQGQRCPNCCKSKGEIKIKEYLENKNINFIQEKTFNDCIGDQSMLSFDFYIPSKNLCIEYDGELHFKPVSFFGGEKSFIKIQKYDDIKNKYCHEKCIKLIRIPYTEYKNIEKILENEI